jgi:hypothetical protein
MKTLSYKPQLAMIAAACSLVACTESTPTSSSAGTETSAAAAPAAPAPNKREPIIPGLYHVCDVETSAKLHNMLAGDHAPVGTAIFIRPIDEATGTTLLCMGETCPDDPTLPGEQDHVFWMSGDAGKVQTVKELEHKKVDRESNTQMAVPPVLHLVQLMAESKDKVPPGCTGKNVHVLRFCEWGPGEEGPTWLCEGPPHAGAVHLQN